MEPHQQSYEVVAASSLSQQQLEVFRLFQMCGVTMTNQKFQVCFLPMLMFLEPGSVDNEFNIV